MSLSTMPIYNVNYNANYNDNDNDNGSGPVIVNVHCQCHGILIFAQHCRECRPVEKHMLLGPRKEVRWAELDENGLHPVVRMHGNLTVMATIARKYETLCELIYKKYFYENKWR